MWRAGLHLVRWQGVDNVMDYVRTIHNEVPELRRDMIRFMNFHIDQIHDYTIQEYLEELQRRMNDNTYSPNQNYEFARAFNYLHQPILDHLSWHENSVMPQ